LNNAAKHAQANHVKIVLTRNNDHVQMIIQDNGKGFDYKRALNSSEREHWGLITMQERAAAIGGTIRVDTNPGTGTSIEVMAALNTTPV
jgi:signal transduction histidine kinase